MLIVDDNAIARSTLRQMLKVGRSLNLIVECENVDETYQYLANQHMDLLLLDAEMPGISGLDLSKGLGKYKPLIILIYSERHYAADGFKGNTLIMAKNFIPVSEAYKVALAKRIHIL